MLGNDGATKVHVHQPSRGELGVVVGEEGRESPLVMVIPVAGGIILPANIDHGMALLKLSRISGANERRGRICREQTEEIDSQSLISMEMAARMKEEQLISNQTNIIGAKKVGVYLWVPMTGGVLSFFAVVSAILKNCWNLSIKRQWVSECQAVR